ncbi:MAG: hypothetical protein J6J27_00605 [Alphaproteobacteria bacterium]|nr:hypothetical protein [Alphaproteobacteria bacterium]
MKWCTILRDFRANNWQELLSLYRKIKHFQDEYEEQKFNCPPYVETQTAP